MALFEEHSTLDSPQKALNQEWTDGYMWLDVHSSAYELKKPHKNHVHTVNSPPAKQHKGLQKCGRVATGISEKMKHEPGSQV